MTTTYLCQFSKKEVGIFRKAGNVARQKKLRFLLENGGNLEGSEPNDVACLLKQWLREMPDPLISPILQDMFIRCLSVELEENCVTACLLTCLLLSPENLQTLKYLLYFLKDIAADSDENKMDVHNLSLIIAPNIFVGPDHSNKIRNDSVQQHAKVVRILIDNADRVGEIPAGLTLQYSVLGSELDSSSDLLDSNTNKSKKKRRSGGPVQDIFSGFKKLVGQNGTPAAIKTPEYDLKIPAYPRSAPKRKADPEQRSLSAVKKQAVSLDGLDSPTLGVTPKHKGLFVSNTERDSNRHVRRKSIGALLRRKDRKRHKSSKVPDTDLCVKTPDNYTDENRALIDETPNEPLFEKCSPLYQGIKRVPHSGSIKKSVSDCHLPKIRTEFSLLPTISVSSSQGCLPNRPIRTSPYNLRTEKCNTRQTIKHVDLNEAILLDEKVKSEKEEKCNKRKSFQNDHCIEKEPSANAIPKHQNFPTDWFSVEDIPHIDNIEDTSSNESCHDSTKQLQNINRISSLLSPEDVNNIVEYTKKIPFAETQNNLNQVNATSENLTSIDEVKEITSNRIGLKRQDGFIVKNKPVSSTSNDDQKSSIDENKSSRNEITKTHKQKLSNSFKCYRNAAPERKSLRRTRHGSLIRGRPNTVKSGLRSETPQRYSHDSALKIKSPPSFIIDKNGLTYGEQEDKSRLVESPRLLSLDLSLSIILQNFCISSPANSPEIPLDVDVASQENSSYVKINGSNNEEKNSDKIQDSVCKKFNETTPEPTNQKRLSNMHDNDSSLKKHSGGNRRRNSSHRASGGKQKSTNTKKSNAQSSEVLSEELKDFENCKENRNILVNNQGFDDSCFKTPNSELRSPDSVTWVSGSSFLSSISSPQDEVTNKRESIAMILKNNTGHVQAKVSLYDKHQQNTSLTKKQYSNDRVLRSSSQKCYSANRMKVSTSISYDSASRSNSVKNKPRYQRSPLPPPPKFTLTDLSTPSPKGSQPLKEVTNVSFGHEDAKPISPSKVIKRITPLKHKSSPSQSVKNTPNPGSKSKKNKRNSFSGYTPHRMPKKVSRSESSPAFQRKEIIICD